MSLLDGKYEILKQRQSGAGRTTFEATAPDGTLLRIEWFDLDPGQEETFERYRRALKRVKRTGRTALYDVTSRPGAHYVAWELPPEGAPPARDGEIEDLLRAHGYQAGDALVLRGPKQPRLYGLDFDGTSAAFEHVASDGEHERRTARFAWPSLPPAVASWGVAVAIVCVAAGLVAVGFQRRANDRIVTVPDLLGEMVNDASRQLWERGFRVTPIPVGSEEPPGSVLALEPEPGAELRPGRAIRVSYALPHGRLPAVTVPRLVGETYPGDVLSRLESAGLALGTVARIAADAPPEVVLAQSAEPGSELRQTDAVHILVSNGPQPEMTFLPDLVGLQVDEARELARASGLAADRVLIDSVSGNGARGTVLSQSLAPFRPIPRDEAVLRLIVSEGGGAGLAAAETPSYVGMERDAAIAAVGSGRVDVEVIEVLSLPEGVVDQDPAPGDPTSGRVHLTINVHPVRIPRPDVRAIVREPELRSLSFDWFVEPGIPQVTAQVYATTLEGDRQLVWSGTTAGGRRVQGEWLTTYPGIVTFALELNGQPYGPAQRVP